MIEITYEDDLKRVRKENPDATIKVELKDGSSLVHRPNHPMVIKVPKGGWPKPRVR